MLIDCSKLPSPETPQPDDVYISLDGAHTLVLVAAAGDGSGGPGCWITYFVDGRMGDLPPHQLPALLASIGARPWGRLDRSFATRPVLTRDPELVAQRLQAFGPHIRALREQYGLSMGDLARALGCPGARLSMLELAQPDPVREAEGVREDEGRAALADLLADTAIAALVGRLQPDGPYDTSGKAEEPSPAKVVVWEAIHVMLTTAPARAAMATIQAARRDDNAVLDAGPFRVGDRVIYKEMEARIAELDADLGSAMLQRPDGEHLIAHFTDLVLANDGVDIETARAGLSNILSEAIFQGHYGVLDDGLTGHDQELFKAALPDIVNKALASDEAQRLIRLHG